ncbi:unnamed protein product (macronuclear) [Paramecium tetraurelia]|uniref:Uncharacterized protein n=1 Tax=Paramecium tetraurelia TaxID=5888 RepID=A0D659_PARTE|nr:uncharacterized protein GSPATT00013956001 [Paramecium tetraurelia]CAK78526.1 unnamed protein product [Paramecium tetraurelia]|eukprot:XP_001445923.1 hypothetical protein (macronuclear) [Paramecium tetraurelia strain d4-2]
MIQINENKLKINLIKKKPNLQIQTSSLPPVYETQIKSTQPFHIENEIDSPEVKKFQALLLDSLTKNHRLSQKFKLFQPIMIKEDLEQHSRTKLPRPTNY